MLDLAISYVHDAKLSILPTRQDNEIVKEFKIAIHIQCIVHMVCFNIEIFYCLFIINIFIFILKGKVVLPKLIAPTLNLMKFFKPETAQEQTKAKNFNKWIREYNTLLSFASVRASLNTPPGFGDFCYRIHGRMYHSAPPLYSCNDRIEAAQYYILDS
jgi:hypothetical protein